MDWSQKVLTARASLCKALQEHYAFVSKHTEILQLADEFDGLKELLPSVPNLQSVSLNTGDLAVSASTAHANVVSQLQEAVDMYSNCQYLLEVHRAIVTLSTAVQQLCQSTVHSSHSFGGLEQIDYDWNDIDHLDGGEEVQDYTLEQVINGTDQWDLGGQRRPESCDIDEDLYTSHVNSVVSSLSEVERLLEQPVKFNKDDTLVFQGFGRSLRDCRMTLNEHIDGLWREWFTWQTFHSTRSGSYQQHHPMGLSQLLNDLRLSTSDATVPSTVEMTNLLTRLEDRTQSVDLRTQMPSVLASFTLLAKPKLLTQLFRLVNALGDPSGRFRELSTVLWNNLFEPWLDKVTSISSQSKSDMDWPKLHIRYLDENTELVGESDDIEAVLPGVPAAAADASVPTILPAWRLELVAPEYVPDKSDNLILSSCQQLASIFQELSKHLFSLNETTSRPVNEHFDEHLVRRLIEGRFASVLPSAKECRSLDFLVSVTQTVYSLASTGMDTGFFTGVLDDDSLKDSTGGGATLLLRWVRDLSRLTENRRTAEILSQVRTLLADTEQFRSTHVAGTETCAKPMSEDGSLNFPSDDQLDSDEMRVYMDLAKTRDAFSESRLLPTLDELLKSKANREDLVRYLDLGHFHFPHCRISKSVPALMQLIKSVVSEAELYLSRLRSAASLDGDGEQQTASLLSLAGAIVELVPRLIMSYTSLVPIFHGAAMDKDLYLISLYHNNCMFLAHECLTLGETCLYPMLEKLHHLRSEASGPIELEQLASVSTCILVPHLRTAGTDMLLRRLRDLRDQIDSTLKGTRGFRDVGLTENRQKCTQLLVQCTDLLRSTACGLRPLPLEVYYRCLGVLCNHLCKEVVGNVLRLIDLTTQDCDALVCMLKDLEVEIDQYFARCPDPDLQPEGSNDPKEFVGLVTRRVPDLSRLRGLLAILTAPTMAVIESVLWSGGAGPLVKEYQFTSGELRTLVQAVYAQSTARDQFLSKLR